MTCLRSKGFLRFPQFLTAMSGVLFPQRRTIYCHLVALAVAVYGRPQGSGRRRNMGGCRAFERRNKVWLSILILAAIPAAAQLPTGAILGTV